ncbi:MAG: hypothetical protein IT577_23845 [Verrucomicrobiae bacterium]|nr:hypothetical protein [Verrucomicrobiae bacterium]
MRAPATSAPSAAQTREFASRFSAEEWDALCSDRRFMDRFADADLEGKFRLDAERILRDHGICAKGGA